ncbi:MAG: hypothetical protein QOH13_83 [Thermoleophilaceae bacterium]|jgi:hypothetical protein|nr:hypothetical protein [Thermoleophilaceae bacterium]
MARMPSGRITLCALALSLAGLTAVPAAIAENHARLGGKITPVLRAFPKNPQPAALFISLGFTGDDGNPPSVLQRAVIQFPYGSQLNGRLFPSCDPKALADKGVKGCAKGSKIGGGTAIGTAADIREEIKVTLFNGQKGKSIVFYLQGDNPVILNVPWASPLEQYSTGLWNFKLTVDVPEILQRIVGLDVAIEDFSVKVNGTRRVNGRKRGYLETEICPPGALIPMRGTFSFLDAPDLVKDSYLSCG